MGNEGTKHAVQWNTVELPSGFDVTDDCPTGKLLVQAREVGQNLTIGAAAEILSTMVNGGGFSRADGRKVGQTLNTAHRTIQSCVIGFLTGIFEGMAENQFTDPRNASAVGMARKIAKLGKGY